MSFVSPTIELAREEGLREGEQKVIIQLLNQRFGEIESSLIEQILNLSAEQLGELTGILLTLPSVTALKQ